MPTIHKGSDHDTTMLSYTLGCAPAPAYCSGMRHDGCNRVAVINSTHPGLVQPYKSPARGTTSCDTRIPSMQVLIMRCCVHYVGHAGLSPPSSRFARRHTRSLRVKRAKHGCQNKQTRHQRRKTCRPMWTNHETPLSTIRGKARASAGWGNARHRLAVTPSSYNIIATGVTTGQAGPGQDPGCLVGRLIWWVAPNHPNQAIPTRRLAGALSALSLSCRRSRPPSPAAASKEDAQGRARGSKQHQPPDYVSNNNSRVPSAGLLFPTLAWLVVHGHCPQLLLICG